MRLGSLAVVPFLLPAAAQAFEPGSLGDAYRDTGYVQGCTTEGELPGCTIIAGGSQFVAPAGGQTPPDVMEKLKALPPLTYVEFRGDLLGVYDSYAEIAVGAVAEAGTPDPYGDTIRALQGDWVSVEDAKSAIRVDGMIWIDVYDGEEVARSVLSFADMCSDGTGEGTAVMELFTIGSLDAGSLCYSVLSVDVGRMELSYLGAGNTLAYTKAD